jgi:hypothetical protein
MTSNSPTEERQQWEYWTEWFYADIVSKAALDAYGSEGWELVSVVVMPEHNAARYELIFKRPKSPNPINTTP